MCRAWRPDAVVTIVALVLVFGIGGMCFSAGEFAIEGIGLAAVTGVTLNLLIPNKNKATKID